jgi:two-component system, sensor histidine kinase YesM
MRLKLNESIREAVSLRAHEKDAQLVALQAQLNPHFIHNALQTIAIIAEDGDNAGLQDLIANLAGILRYVSSTDGTTATLGTEVEYTKSYLAAMQARFGESLEYTIVLPEAIREIVVPRLILQPFIENCFKYATADRPPWRFEVRGSSGDGGWTVEVLDNGPGFTPATLARLGSMLEDTAGGEGGLPGMSISGMGILNSFERLKLTFGASARFDIANRPEGGARIAMGVDYGA